MKQTEQNEYKLLQGTSREFAQKVLLKHRAENDRYPLGNLDPVVFDKAYEMDFFHLWLPEKMGGLDRHLGKLCTILTNIAEVDASMATAVLTTAMAQEIMLQAGALDRLAEVYGRCAAPMDALLAFAAFGNPLEQPPEISVMEKDGRLSLTGKVKGMVLGNLAKHLIVPGRFSNDADNSYLLVPSAQATMRIGEPVLGLGLRACPLVDIDFNETTGFLVGARGKAAEYYWRMYDQFILAGAAVAVGIMRGAFTDALKYSQARIQGGKKIGAWSEVQLLLADMALKVKSSELLIEHAGTGSGINAIHDNIAAGLTVMEHAGHVTSDGVQILGGYGYMEEYSQEKRFRDAQHLQALFGISYLKKIHFIKTCYKLA